MLSVAADATAIFITYVILLLTIIITLAHIAGVVFAARREMPGIPEERFVPPPPVTKPAPTHPAAIKESVLEGEVEELERMPKPKPRVPGAFRRDTEKMDKMLAEAEAGAEKLGRIVTRDEDELNKLLGEAKTDKNKVDRVLSSVEEGARKLGRVVARDERELGKMLDDAQMDARRLDTMVGQARQELNVMDQTVAEAKEDAGEIEDVLDESREDALNVDQLIHSARKDVQRDMREIRTVLGMLSEKRMRPPEIRTPHAEVRVIEKPKKKKPEGTESELAELGDSLDQMREQIRVLDSSLDQLAAKQLLGRELKEWESLTHPRIQEKIYQRALEKGKAVPRKKAKPKKKATPKKKAAAKKKPVNKKAPAKKKKPAKKR
jgi:hypothetical protein